MRTPGGHGSLPGSFKRGEGAVAPARPVGMGAGAARSTVQAAGSEPQSTDGTFGQVLPLGFPGGVAPIAHA